MWLDRRRHYPSSSGRTACGAAVPPAAVLRMDRRGAAQCNHQKQTGLRYADISVARFSSSSTPSVFHLRFHWVINLTMSPSSTFVVLCRILSASTFYLWFVVLLARCYLFIMGEEKKDNLSPFNLCLTPDDVRYSKLRPMQKRPFILRHQPVPVDRSARRHTRKLSLSISYAPYHPSWRQRQTVSVRLL